VQATRPYISLGRGWFARLEFGPDHPGATIAAIGQRLVAELGARFDAYHPNDPEEGAEYAMTFLDRMALMVVQQNGVVAGIGADRHSLPFLLRIGELYGAERRGWRWPLYWLWLRMARSPKTPRKARYPIAAAPERPRVGSVGRLDR
jgi:hypothetical protein